MFIIFVCNITSKVIKVGETLSTYQCICTAFFLSLYKCVVQIRSTTGVIVSVVSVSRCAWELHGKQLER
jgi:hypothetical protein